MPQGILDRFKEVATANVWDILLGHSGVYFSYIENVHLRTPGERLAARARTLRYLPPRPDLLAQVQAGADGPEYRAMARCGPGDVLVCDVMGDSRPCVFGDVKALQLRMNNADGIVTDGSIRDLGVMVQEEFGLIIYARDRTPRGGVPYAVPAQENVDVQCGGALVRPGDVLVGDDDGVVVVPSWFAEECVELTEEYEAVETRTKERILAEGAVPGQYYTPPGRPGSRKRRPFAAIRDGLTAQQSRSRREQHRHESGRGGLRDCPAIVADPARLRSRWPAPCALTRSARVSWFPRATASHPVERGAARFYQQEAESCHSFPAGATYGSGSRLSPTMSATTAASNGLKSASTATPSGAWSNAPTAGPAS